MDTDTLRHTLCSGSDGFAAELTERVIDVLAGPPGADGMPSLDFLPEALQVSVLAALYRNFIEQATARRATVGATDANRAHQRVQPRKT